MRGLITVLPTGVAVRCVLDAISLGRRTLITALSISVPVSQVSVSPKRSMELSIIKSLNAVVLLSTDHEIEATHIQLVRSPCLPEACLTFLSKAKFNAPYFSGDAVRLTRVNLNTNP